MRSSVLRSLGFSAVAICLAGVGSGSPAGAPGFVRIKPSDVVWHDVPGGHGAQQAVLLGDPTKPGWYVVRVKFPPHLMDAPHWHPHARYITVLEGTWYTGTGNTFDMAQAVPLPAGSFMLHPARAMHWDGSAGGDTVVLQIIGEGPTEGGQADPRQPQWIDLPPR